jgi:hypothetical protein
VLLSGVRLNCASDDENMRTYLSFVLGHPHVAHVVRFAGGLRAPHLGRNPRVGEQEHRQRQRVLQNQQRQGVEALRVHRRPLLVAHVPLARLVVLVRLVQPDGKTRRGAFG